MYTPDLVQRSLQFIGFDSNVAKALTDSQLPIWQRAIDEGFRANVGILFASGVDRIIGVYNIGTNIMFRQTVVDQGEEVLRATTLKMMGINDGVEIRPTPILRRKTITVAQSLA